MVTDFIFDQEGYIMIFKEFINDLRVYEPGKPIEETARELGFSSTEGFCKLASNENELGPSPMAMRAMQSAMTEMHRYPDGGAFYLKEKLSAQLGVQPENLLFGAGSNELIVFLCHIFLNAEANLVMSERAFAVYFLAAALFESKAVMVPMRDGFTHDLVAMAEAITAETRIVAVCNPNNPTGTLVAQAELEAFVEAVPSNVLIVFDEAYFELLPDAQKPDMLKYVREGRENVLILRTFSKAYGLAGLRIGYAVGHPDLIGMLNKTRQPFNVNAMAQAGAMAAIEDEQHLDETRQMTINGLAQFSAAFESMGLEYVPSVTNFILVKTENGRDICGASQQRKVIARPMDPYGLPEWIRISVGTEEQNKQCLIALKTVLEK